jgi:mono/diheme cytochrome c family protein
MTDPKDHPETPPPSDQPDPIAAFQAELADLRLPKPPFWAIGVGITLVVISWLPLALIAKARTSKSTEPRVHIFQDMDVQPRYGPQATSKVFADGRSMRQPVPGTVAQGELFEDDHYAHGFRGAKNAQTGKWEVTYFEGFPANVKVNEDLILRGQERFNIYCSVCHGKAGYGDGPIHVRAVELKGPWVAPTSMHVDTVRARQEGHLFNTITNGIRTMPAYGQQIPIDDRWAIVAYIRALQLSQNAPIDLVPAEKRAQIR